MNVSNDGAGSLENWPRGRGNGDNMESPYSEHILRTNMWWRRHLEWVDWGIKMDEMINLMIPRDFEIVCPRNKKFDYLVGDAVQSSGGQCEVLQFLGSWRQCGSVAIRRSKEKGVQR